MAQKRKTSVRKVAAPKKVTTPDLSPTTQLVEEKEHAACCFEVGDRYKMQNGGICTVLKIEDDCYITQQAGAKPRNWRTEIIDQLLSEKVIEKI